MSASPVKFHFLQTVNLRNRQALKAFIPSIFKREKVPLTSLTYIFCSDDYLLDINRQYLNHDYYTDIITFDLSEGEGGTVGEIYISIDRVRDNARQFNTSLSEELHRVIFHGALHLCGYKDKTAQEEKLMRTKEAEYLAKWNKKKV
ncbi:rRNA maturation RNase YbeY [Pseudoflavitalea sp. X16]|uniref:rRNA maturation RNase YbeY n=1 Tax=Paraflavitalea devenefica TaxID=2716334 RepID=UPI00141DAEEF|nr:rRNA maturation RNase YbeY [Paraflavitalea devenefica]NII24502.1 rRNA maturation RNase YbeY [Paraflavitalea devenefica]